MTVDQHQQNPSKNDSQVDELVQFVAHPNPKIQHLALDHLNGLVVGDVKDKILQCPARLARVIEAGHGLITSCESSVDLRHSALQLFINMAKSVDARAHFAPVLSTMVDLVVRPTSVVADLACMLLSNVSLDHEMGLALIRTERVHELVDVFSAVPARSYNPNAEFHFLGSVFANLSQHLPGRSLFLNTHLLSKLIPFATHTNLIRRGGIISLVKNICFQLNDHAHFIDPDHPHFLIHTLLAPLIENRTLFSDTLLSSSDFDSLPDASLWLISHVDHLFETDAQLRRCLVESLIVLCSTRAGRTAIRDSGAYYVLRDAHVAEPCPVNQVLMERVVDLLVRDEAHGVSDPIPDLLPCVNMVVPDFELEMLVNDGDDTNVQTAYLLNPRSETTNTVFNKAVPKPAAPSLEDDDDDLIIEEII